MDLIVRGVKMPESCEECPVCDYEQANCLLCDERNTLPHDGRRRDWCPLLALPEGHGRLVDAYALMAQFIEATMQFKNGYDFERLLEKAETIVPAEGGGDLG